MGRGFSVHQKQILLLAHKNHLAMGGEEPDLYLWEIYVHIFGLEPDFKDHDKRCNQILKFEKSVDKGKLNSVRASASRSIRRLLARELIEFHSNGMNLTPEGLEYAEGLTVNESELITPSATSRKEV